MLVLMFAARVRCTVILRVYSQIKKKTKMIMYYTLKKWFTMTNDLLQPFALRI